MPPASTCAARSASAAKVDPIYTESIEEIPDIVSNLVRGGDIVITQGAGSVSTLVKMLADRGLQ